MKESRTYLSYQMLYDILGAPGRGSGNTPLVVLARGRAVRHLGPDWVQA